MYKFLRVFVCLMILSVPLMAQSIKDRPEKPFYVALEGGAAYSVNENFFSYYGNGSGGKLINGIGSVSFGYDFSYKFGVRLNCAYGRNSGANNTVETYGNGFYPYTFQSVNLFADALLNIAEEHKVFNPKFYAGVGVGFTFGFTDSGHPWQQLNSPNTAFGVRLGFLPQWDISARWSVFADLCAEGYSDVYDGGLCGGLPFDFRAALCAGAMIKF